MQTTTGTQVVLLDIPLDKLNERLKPIWQLDFTNLKRKLQKPAPEGKGWSVERCDEVELWYRRFLAICLLYPDHSTVPNGPIDAFWHTHILDTMAYHNDCDAVFGFYLHHYPYFGLNGDADQRDDAFDQTNARYQHHFSADCTTLSFFAKEQTGFGEDCNNGGENCGGSGCKTSDGG